MKKKIIALLLVLTLALSATACNAQATTDTNISTDTSTKQGDTTNEATDTQDASMSKNDSSTETSTNTVEPRPLEVLEADVRKDVEDSISILKGEMETLVTEIDSFDKYVDNVDKMETFYTKICSDSSLCCGQAFL